MDVAPPRPVLVMVWPGASRSSCALRFENHDNEVGGESFTDPTEYTADRQAGAARAEVLPLFPEEAKIALKALTPGTYIGNAVEQAKKI